MSGDMAKCHPREMAQGDILQCHPPCQSPLYVFMTAIAEQLQNILA